MRATFTLVFFLFVGTPTADAQARIPLKLMLDDQSFSSTTSRPNGLGFDVRCETPDGHEFWFECRPDSSVRNFTVYPNPRSGTDSARHSMLLRVITNAFGIDSDASEWLRAVVESPGQQSNLEKGIDLSGWRLYAFVHKGRITRLSGRSGPLR